MLNGDAHHSKRRDGELRISRCLFSKTQSAVPQFAVRLIKASQTAEGFVERTRHRIPEWDAIVAMPTLVTWAF